jgi:hypothetical protein
MLVSSSFKLSRPLFDRLSTFAARLRVWLAKLRKVTPRLLLPFVHIAWSILCRAYDSGPAGRCSIACRPVLKARESGWRSSARALSA